MKRTIKSNSVVDARELIFVTKCAIGFLVDFDKNKKFYKKELKKQVYNGIEQMGKDVAKICIMLNMYIIESKLKKEDRAIREVDAVEHYMVYRYATFFLEGVKNGVIKDVDNIINGRTAQFVDTVYKRADEYQKELDEAVEDTKAENKESK